MIKIFCDVCGVIICYVISFICYKNISNQELKILKFKNILILLLISSLGYFNNYINFSVTRAIVHLLILTLLFYLIFNENIKKTFIKALIIYIVVCICELLLSFVIVFTVNIYFNNNIIIKLFFSTIVMLFSLLVFESNKVINFSKKTVEYLINKKSSIVNLLFTIFLCSIILLIFKMAVNTTLNTYVNNILILIIVLVFFIFFIIQYIKTKKAEEKEEILLDFVSKYERILDNDRINKHEILNNLLILKSFKNKNTKEYEETLNLIIKEYENKDKNLFVNLYNLPAGLKGLLYYKVYEMKNFNINVFLNISNKVIPKLEKIDSKNFAKLCKILGIVLDNAKEASENSEDKNIAIDIYKENKKIVIYVENSTKNDVEISKIYEKNYSTKGKDRGLGLYIAKEIVNNSVIFELEQFINESKNFVSIITII
jgi:two-component system sensor histidine kinase AgrC